MVALFSGGLGIGPVADKEGRRAALAATTLPLAVGTLISAGANSFGLMMLGRDARAHLRVRGGGGMG